MMDILTYWSSSAGETLNDSLSTSSLLVGDLANSAGNRSDTGAGVALSKVPGLFCIIFFLLAD